MERMGNGPDIETRSWTVGQHKSVWPLPLMAARGALPAAGRSASTQLRGGGSLSKRLSLARPAPSVPVLPLFRCSRLDIASTRRKKVTGRGGLTSCIEGLDASRLAAKKRLAAPGTYTQASPSRVSP